MIPARPPCLWRVQPHKQDRANKFTISRHAFTARRLFVSRRSRLFEIANVHVRLDPVASIIVNPNHGIM